MKASTIYNLDKDLTVSSGKINLLAESDMSRFGVFALETLNFHNFKQKVVKRYTLEAYELRSDGYPEMIECYHFNTKKELLAAYKNFQLGE